MKKEYVLPVCFAAAAHGALLFGFTKPPRSTPLATDDRKYVPFVLPPPEDPPVVVEAERRSPSAPAADVQPLPRSQEPLAQPVVDGPTFTPPSFRPFEKGDIKEIVNLPPGVGKGPGGASWGDIVSTDHLDNSPRTRLQAQPVYPHEARRNGMSGHVMVEFIVDERGRVLDPRVVSATDRVFEEATLRAVAKWQFEPGRRDGKIVRFRMAVPVVFNLNE